MPTIDHGALDDLICRVLTTAGVPVEEARVVSDHLTKANLLGHDSHGLIRVPGYVELIEEGKIIPGAPIEVVEETATTAVVDGGWGLGFVVTKFATDLAIQKAKDSGVAGVTIRQQSHMGRLGWYSERISRADLIGFVTADSGRAPKSVAPYGGRSRRLGTNPLSFSVPAAVDGPVILDMATSTVAHGKIRVAAARGQEIPKGWLVDKDGRGTHDPNALAEGGALMPFGADQAHKGYGLSFMVEVFSGLLTGIGYSHDPGGFSNDGAFVSAFDVARFRPLDDFKEEMAGFVSYLKESPLAEGHDEIFYPGEIEHRTEMERRKAGVPIEPATWSRITALCERLDVSLPELLSDADPDPLPDRPRAGNTQ